MKEIGGLNWLRGLAAILVLLSHARPFFFVSYQDYAGARTFAIQVFYLITGLGTSAVAIFFVLSGYLVAGSVERTWRAGTWDMRRYLAARLSRLWAVLLPVLVLTLVLDWIGAGVVGSEFYAGRLGAELSSGPDGVASDWSLLAFLGNMAFLQTIWSPVFGSNGPLWSIANELWYYMMFPLLFMAFQTGRRRAFHLGVFAGIALLVGWEIVKLFPIWLAGYGAWHIRNSATARRIAHGHALPLALVLGLLVVMLLLRAAQMQHTMPGYYLIGLLTFLAIPALHHPMFETGAWISGWISRVSYSLYLVHFPVLALLAAAIGNARATTFSAGLPIFLAGVTLSGLVGWLTWALFERHTPVVKAVCERCLGGPVRKGTLS